MIKTYKIDENVLEFERKLEYQNRENKKIPCEIDCFSCGVLLDNYILYGKRCLIFFQEMCINPNMSGLYMVTCDYKYRDECIRIIDYACSLMD